MAEKLNLKTIKRFTKKELISLIKEHLSDSVKIRGLTKRSKSELIAKITESDKWKCLQRVVSVKPRRKQTDKQREAFKKMKQNVQDRLLGIKETPKIEVAKKILESKGVKDPSKALINKELNELKKQVLILRKQNEELNRKIGSPVFNQFLDIESDINPLNVDPVVSESSFPGVGVPVGSGEKSLKEDEEKVDKSLAKFRSGGIGDPLNVDPVVSESSFPGVGVPVGSGEKSLKEDEEIVDQFLAKFRSGGIGDPRKNENDKKIRLAFKRYIDSKYADDLSMESVIDVWENVFDEDYDGKTDKRNLMINLFNDGGFMDNLVIKTEESLESDLTSDTLYDFFNFAFDNLL